MANVTYEVQANDAASEASVAKVDMKFEIVVIPVSDVDRAKRFYEGLGWRCDANPSCRSRFPAEACNFPWLRRCASAFPSGRVPQAGMPGRPNGKEGSSCVAR